MDFQNVGNMSSFDKNMGPQTLTNFRLCEIVLSLICLIGICANFFIIYVTLHFKRMQTVPNILLANWAIVDLCSLTLFTITSIIEYHSLSTKLKGYLYDLLTALDSVILLFVIVVLTDWCIAVHFEKTSRKLRLHFKLIVAFWWILILLFVGISMGFRFSPYLDLTHRVLYFFGYCALLLVVIFLHCFRIAQNSRGKRSNYPTLTLTLVTAFAASWFLGALEYFIKDYYDIFSLALSAIAGFSMFCTSIVTLSLLYHLNNDFQASFRQVLRRSSNKYEEANFDLHSPVVSNSINNPSITIAFHKDSEAMVHET